MTGNNEYSKITKEHFFHPRNVGRIENADGYSRIGNPACGDQMDMYIKIGINENGEEYIEDIKWQTFGCGAAIASTSMMSERVKGKTLKELLAIGETDRERRRKQKKELIDCLEGLPAIKEHCSVLASDGLYSAIENYFLKREEPKKEEKLEGGEHEH